MGNLINKKILIDPETGQILKEHSWAGYDGFNENGYAYRARGNYLRFFNDSLPSNLSKESLLLLLMMAELMNEENVLVYRVERKSKFSSIIYRPLDKYDIREKTRFVYGINKFDKCWQELSRRCIKRVKYRDNILAWAVNPSVLTKTKYVPFWLYGEFQDSMNPHLSPITIQKLQDRISSYE